MNFSSIKLDATSLEKNYLYYLNKTGKKIIPVIKSNAYGHGLIQIASLLEKIGVEVMAVASFEEAFYLRTLNVKTEILILNPVEIEKLYFCHLNNLTISIHSLDYLRTINSIPYTIKIHLKINTGLNRFGIEIYQIEQIKKLLENNRNIHLKGIYSHIKGGVEKSTEINEQIDIFKECLKNFENTDLNIHLVSTNSVDFDPDFTTAIRLGMGLYGLDKNAQNNTSPILKLTSKIIHIKKVKKGSKIGYNSHYIVKEDGYIYTIPFGYYDFTCKNIKYSLIVGGKKHQPVTRFMNSTQFFSKIKYNLYDIVSIIDNTQSILDIAKRNKKTPYEIAVLLPKDTERQIIY